MEDREDIDFSPFQRELDVAFHSRRDVYPAGSPEHSELLQFLPRLHRLRQQQRSGVDLCCMVLKCHAHAHVGPCWIAAIPMSRKGSSDGKNQDLVEDDRLKEKAQALGIPATYDARYRVSCTLALVDREGYREAVRGLERRLRNMSDPPSGWKASEVGQYAAPLRGTSRTSLDIVFLALP